MDYSWAFQKRYTQKISRLVGTGVDNCGTVPAALVTFLSLQKLEGKVDLLINAGTCGGFKAKGAEIGDVFLTTASANHDRRIPIPSFDHYGVGRIETLAAKELADEIKAKMGVCTTGNSLDMHDIDEVNMKSNDASVKDMECEYSLFILGKNIFLICTTYFFIFRCCHRLELWVIQNTSFWCKSSHRHCWWRSTNTGWIFRKLRSRSKKITRINANCHRSCMWQTSSWIVIKY